MQRIGSRYKEGFVIAEWNSYTGSKALPPDGVSTAKDHVIKRLVVSAVQDEKFPSVWDLVARVEIEVVAIEGDEDEGHYEGVTREVYRLPFPRDVHSRKQILRHMQAQPHFHRHQ